MKNLYLLLIALTVFSCKKHDSAVILTDNQKINAWIESSMKQYYYWNDNINAYSLDKNMEPEEFFKKILYSADEHSYMMRNVKDLLSQINGNKQCGYGYLLYSDNSGIVGKVAYVNKNSAAEKSGLQRGMNFTKINGIQLTEDNYSELTTKTKNQHSLTVTYQGAAKEYILSPTENGVSPIYLDTIYTINSSNIGYLVYNSFTPDNGDLSKEYDRQLNEVFGRFKENKVNELIVDLRYNTTGYLTSSTLLASLLVKNLSTKSVYAVCEYNKEMQEALKKQYGNDYLNVYFQNEIEGEPINNIGNYINKVYIITSSITESISEVLINGLKPYMNVVLIGSKTTGKNTASVVLYEENHEQQQVISCAIVPIIMKIANKAGNADYTFIPDVEAVERMTDNLPLGDIGESLLSEAIGKITGNKIMSKSMLNKNEIIPLNNRIIYVENKAGIKSQY